MRSVSAASSLKGATLAHMEAPGSVHFVGGSKRISDGEAVPCRCSRQGCPLRGRRLTARPRIGLRAPKAPQRAMRLWSYPAPRKLVARRGGKGASAAQPVDDEESPGGWGIDMDAMGRRAEDARAELEGIRDRVADMLETRHEGFVAHVLGRELGEPEQGVFADAIWGRARGRAFVERRCSRVPITLAGLKSAPSRSQLRQSWTAHGAPSCSASSALVSPSLRAPCRSETDTHRGRRASFRPWLPPQGRQRNVRSGLAKFGGRSLRKSGAHRGCEFCARCVFRRRVKCGLRAFEVGA